MNEQPEALRLAEKLEVTGSQSYSGKEAIQAAAAELRRLHEVNQALVEACEAVVRFQELADSDATSGLLATYGEAYEKAKAALAKAKGESNE